MVKRSLFQPEPEPVFFDVTVSAVREHAAEIFRPGVVYRVREDILEGLADIVVTKESV